MAMNNTQLLGATTGGHGGHTRANGCAVTSETSVPHT